MMSVKYRHYFFTINCSESVQKSKIFSLFGFHQIDFFKNILNNASILRIFLQYQKGTVKKEYNKILF